MSIFANYKTSRQLEVEGIIVEFPGCEIKIARAGNHNAAFTKELERLTRPHRKAIKNNRMPIEQMQSILRKVYAKTVIRGWWTHTGEIDEKTNLPKVKEGIEGPNGDLLKVNLENIENTFNLLPDLFTDVVEAAENIALYQADVIGDAIKNS